MFLILQKAIIRLMQYKIYKNIRIKEIIVNKELLKVFTEKINKETSISLRRIAETLGVDRKILRKIIMTKYTSL